MKPPGSSWIQQRTDTKKQEIHRKKLWVQHHACNPIEYNIGNSYCHKEYHLGMEPVIKTQIKTVIGQLSA